MTWVVQALGSVAPVGHTLARTVVGSAPTAWNRTVVDDVGDTRAPATVTRRNRHQRPRGRALEELRPHGAVR